MVHVQIVCMHVFVNIYYIYLPTAETEITTYMLKLILVFNPVFLDIQIETNFVQLMGAVAMSLQYVFHHKLASLVFFFILVTLDFDFDLESTASPPTPTIKEK